MGGDPETYTASRAALPLTTPTYDESGQATHPDVYDAGAGNTWNGYRYWMAMTPYPAATAAYENPSILASADGQTWVVPDGLTNPVVAFVPGSLNSDPDLTMVGSTLYLIYRFASGGNDIIKEVHSTDGVTWSSPATLFTVTANNCLSPAIIWNDSEFRMYSINNSSTMQMRTASSITGTWSAPTTLTIYLPTSSLWHVDVVYSGGVYYAFHNLGADRLYLTNSADGIEWAFPSPALLAAGTTDIWDKLIYRATAVKTAAGFDIWYGARNAANEWRIGFTQSA